MLTHKQLRAKALDIADVRAKFEKLSGEYALLGNICIIPAKTLTA